MLNLYSLGLATCSELEKILEKLRETGNKRKVTEDVKKEAEALKRGENNIRCVKAVTLWSTN